MFKTIKQIHFVGIGGSGMSGIAEVLLRLGYRVSGSDLQKNAEATRLEKSGAVVFIGHEAKNIAGADVVVTSTAVSKKNPEVQAALDANIPVIPRIEMLAEIARLKYTIAIAGTHGKTTTTSLVGQMLKVAGLDPTVIVGGRLKSVGTNGVLGTGDFLVAEADESDGSFLKLSPTISVVTNIDNDHMDYYKTEERLLDAFTRFAGDVPFYGITFLCGDDVGVKKILPQLKRRFATYGFSSKCDFRATDIQTDHSGSQFNVEAKGKVLGRISLPLSGKHNVLNSLAAAAVGLKAGLDFKSVAHGLSRFEGVGRRIEVKGQAMGVTVVDDYGHHPTEIKATLSAVREKWPQSRLIVLFQPHRYSRTKALYKEFAAALSTADYLYLFPIYAAGEKPLKNVTSQLIYKNLKKVKAAAWVEDRAGENSIDELIGLVKNGDVILTLGAGDVWKRGENLLKRLSEPATVLMRDLKKLGKRIRAHESLSRHCTWGLGGPADVFAELHHLDELLMVRRLCREHAIPLLILGWGSNILLPDEGFRGCVVKLRGDFEKIDIRGTTVKVGAGVHLPKLSHQCADRGLEGVEALAGVPGTIGGALMTNAGTPRGVIGDVLSSVDVLDEDGNVTTLTREQIHLAYRESNLVGKVVVGATLELKKSSKEDVLSRIKHELSVRAKTQPLGTKNVGSVFRNPENDHSARLIEAAGLKGHVHGGLRVSPKHANFIENTGRGTAAEALELIQMIQSKVKEKFGVSLIPEVKVIGA